MIIFCFIATALFAPSQLFASAPIYAEGYAGIYLGDDSWTIDKDSMRLDNAKNCDKEVKYEHSGKYKTIGSCKHKGDADDVRGDFYYDYEATVLYRGALSKGFALKANKVKCHYQLQTMGAPTFNYYYHVDCKLSDDNVSITPFNGACSKNFSLEISGGQDGVTLKPTCKD